MAILTMLATATAADAAPTGSITEFSTGLNEKTQPEAIAPGPDGNVWFIDGEFPPSIGRVTPSGMITELPVLSKEHDLEDITPGPDGNMWFGDNLTGSSGAIASVTPSGTITEYPLPVGTAPADITLGPDGNLWFTVFVSGMLKEIGKITPGGTVTEYSSGFNAESLPIDIAPGSDGNLWFTDGGTTGAIGKITPGGTVTEFSGGLNAETHPESIAPGPDGNLWFTDGGTTKAIGKITPGGTITEYSAGLNAGSEPVDIAPGADGNLWFTDQGATRAIGKITPSGTITEYSAGLNQESRPLDIAPGSDGNIWFSDSTKPQAIGRVGTGAPEALASPLVVSGGGQAGSSQLCTASWSTWAGQQPSTALYAFDGYRWLLDGSQVASGPSYTPTAANVGHQLSCSETVTYPLLDVTIPAASASVTVVAPPAPASTTPVSPVVGNAHESAKRWREGRNLAQISRRKKKPPVGTTFSFSLNEQASVSFSFTQRVGGRKVGHKCLSKTRKSRGRKTCKRTVVAGTLTFTGHVGTNKVVFRGRISHSKKLTRGHYTLVITAANSAGEKSVPQKLSFTIVK